MSGTLRLRGATSGYSELQAPAVAADQTFVLPTAGGTLLTTDSPVPKLTLELGSASQPSLTFEGDTDTGLYSSGTNTLNLVTGGNNRLVIDSSGNVGIGDSAPSEKLNVAGNMMLEGGDQYLYLTNAGTGNSGIYVRGNTSGSYLRSHSTGIFTWEVTGSEKMRLNSSGNVGIGETNPTSLLHLSSASSPALRLQDTTNDCTLLLYAQNTNSHIGTSSNHELFFDTNGSQRMMITTGGNIGIGTSSPTMKVNISHADQDGLRFNSVASGETFIDFADPDDNDIGRVSYDHSDNHMAFRTNNGERMRIDSAGRVGIGTSSPTNVKLDIKEPVSNTAGTGHLGFSGGSTPLWVWRLSDSDADLYLDRYSGGWITTPPLTIKRDTGNVGIGTTSPAAKLDISHGNELGLLTTGPYNFQAKFESTDSEAAIVIEDSNSTNDGNRIGVIGDNMAFTTANTESVRIDSSGRLLVGTSTNVTNGLLQVEGVTSAISTLRRNTNSLSSGPAVQLRRSYGTSLGSYTAVADGGNCGYLQFMGSTGAADAIVAQISAAADGQTLAASDNPGRLVFSTTPDGSSNPTERMRITQKGTLNVAAEGGNFGGGNATARFSSISAASVNYANQQVAVIHNKGTSGTRYMMSFGDGATYTERGFISWDGSNMALVNSSDKRLKTNITESNSAIESVKQINVRSFNFIENNNYVDYGFIAQELRESAPEAVNIGTDDEHGNIDKPWTVGYATLVPRLTKALQEAIAKIETLEANNLSLENRIAALENN